MALIHVALSECFVVEGVYNCGTDDFSHNAGKLAAHATFSGSVSRVQNM